MSDVEVLLKNKTGPLPITVDWQETDNLPQVFYVGGSAYNASGPGLVGVQLLIDGNLIDTVQVWVNEKSSHRALVGKMIPVPALSLGNHKITLQAAPGTSTDDNDLFALAVFPQRAFVLNQKGPIPAYTTFKSEVSGPALIFLSGSAYSAFVGSIGIYLVIDGTPVLTSSVWANEINSHHAMPAVFGITELTPGDHQIGFSTTTGDMQTDQNDFFSAAVFS